MKTLPSDPFLRGYLLAAMFTEDPEPVSGEFETSGRPEELLPRIPDDFLADSERDCAEFQTKAARLLAKAADVHGRDLESCGMDFWYSRNGHGVGFWDRGMGDVGEDLDGIAAAQGEHYLDLSPC